MVNRLFQSFGRKQKAVLQAVIASLVVTGSFALWRQVGTTLESLELYSRDWMFQLKRNPSSDPIFLIVGITENDIKEYGDPIPDRTITQLLRTLNQANPQTIGLDIIRDRPLGGNQAEQEQLLQVVQEQPNIFAVCKVGTDIDPGYPPPPGILKSQIGVSNLPSDAGGIIRRGLIGIVPPSFSSGDAQDICQDPSAPLFSLGFQTAREYLENVGIQMEITARDEIQFENVTISPLTPTSGGYLQADTGGYQILLNFPLGTQGPQQVTLAEVLNQEIEPELFHNRIIFVGYVAESKKDIYSTPFNSRRQNNLPMPGVVIHAQLASQIIGNVFKGQAVTWYMPDWAEILWIWVWACLGGVIAAFIRHPFMIMAGTLGLLGLCGGIALASFAAGGWVLLATPILAYAITLTGVSLVDRYAQPISRQIKEFLQIDIEIDRNEVQDTIQEIEESEAFQEIKQAGQRLRKKQRKNPKNSVDAGRSERNTGTGNTDFPEQETQQSLSSSQNFDSPEIPSSISEETLTKSTDLDSYFNQIRDLEAQIKQQNDSNNESNSDSSSD